MTKTNSLTSFAGVSNGQSGNAWIVTEKQALAGIMQDIPHVRRGLVFAPHPDDEIFGCAGVMMYLQKISAEVFAVVVTDGALGGAGDGMFLAEARANESLQAASILGLPPPEFWRLPDRSLAQDDRLVARIRDAVAARDPQLVLLPAPTEIHPDHQALALAGIDALQQLGGDRWIMFYEISNLIPTPNVVLDISPFEHLKQEAMHCFSSQLQEQPYDRRIKGLNCYRAYHLGPHVSCAEAYYLIHLDELQKGLPAHFDWQWRYRYLLAEKEAESARHVEEIAKLKHSIDGQKQVISTLEKLLEDKKREIARLDEEVVTSRRERAKLQVEIDDLLGSTSWRVTAPARYLSGHAKKGMQLLCLVPQIVRKDGGILKTLRKATRIVAREGFSGLMLRTRVRLARRHATVQVVEPTNPGELLPRPVPYYIDPRIDQSPIELKEKASLAIHLHLYYTEMLPEFTSRLKSLPLTCDFYVSVPENADCEAICGQIAQQVPSARQVIVERVPNRGRDIAPLIAQFGARLSRYDIIGHFHTKRSPHNPALQHWCSEILDLLIGMPGNQGGRLAHIFSLLLGSASMVYPEGNNMILKDRTGWGENQAWARQLLQRHTSVSIDDFPVVEFPEGSMFWARKDAVRELLGLPLGFDDFPSEPLPADGTLAHAIERLILVLSSQSNGRPYRLHRGDSIRDYREYESQRDYSASLVHKDIKVLSYYLPQFHPIAENDLWHGEGFTEWTKVRAANPLFIGHYQQHIPHPDIGYYLIDDPAILRKQAEMMKKSGVHGQVFYHYWFSGKLILERPARLLLENPEIAMPFCFCWANENWTRRWDGNEDEVLLHQEYSEADARAFIRYLIPFFRDPRYIRIENRPVLFVYRPSSLPAGKDYIRIWREECRAAGLEFPYTVAVLTRGARSPAEFDMDAGVERVLHDWTSGAVQDIQSSLHFYHAFNGSVLHYDDVVDHYMAQPTSRSFTHFRSLIPNWDNTARYGSDAYLVHGSTPQRFQSWLEHSIASAQANLPADRRFILVNAWNEWAEGAHLEPDTRFGYAYLNSIGRALSGIHYGQDPQRTEFDPAKISLHISIPEFISNQLAGDPHLAMQFRKCFSDSHILRQLGAVTTDAEVDFAPELPDIGRGRRGDADYVLELRRTALFESEAIERMLALAHATPGSVVIANVYDDGLNLIVPTANGSVHLHEAYASPMVLLPKAVSEGGVKNCRLAADAHCIATLPAQLAWKERPAVTTIIRVHKGADLRLLAKALLCLAAMRDCVVTPLLAGQDLDEQQLIAVRRLLDATPFVAGVVPRLELYQSPGGAGDLRARMLNESLRQVDTRYAAFLDYDDLVMPHAYAWLIERLRRSGKAISFGRVFSTTCDASTGQLLERKRVYEYGFSYEDFLQFNHAPLHSFMLDLERLNLDGVIYYDDQRYLEDYLLMLQLCTPDNTDWGSLAENHYIGDYIHCLNRSHTLAIVDADERQVILDSPEYRMCEERIRRLKAELIARLPRSGGERISAATEAR